MYYDQGQVIYALSRVSRLCAYVISANIESRALITLPPFSLPTIRHSHYPLIPTHYSPPTHYPLPTRRTHVQFMASLPLINPSVVAETSPTPTKVDQDTGGLAGGLGLERGPTATATTRRSRSEQALVIDPNISPPINLRPRRPRRPSQHHHGRGGLQNDGSSGFRHALSAIKRFFFAEDKTLREGYIPNYRCAS